MKVNYRRTVNKQREEIHQEWLRKRNEKLEAMTDEEREQFLREERERVHESLSLAGLVNTHLSDTSYSNL